jgi:hypothetical protein
MDFPRVPQVINVTLTTAGVEQSQAIVTDADTQPAIKSLQIRSRSSDSLQYGFVASGPYSTIPADQTYWKENMQAWTLTLYLVGSVNGQVVEIEVWR